MKILNFLIVVCAGALFVSCASQRTRATCAETEYRLNSMSYSPDQRAFLEEELRQCRELQAEQEKDDVITNKVTGSIRERFAADSAAKASAAKDSVTEAVETAPAENEDVRAAENSGAQAADNPEALPIAETKNTETENTESAVEQNAAVQNAQPSENSPEPSSVENATEGATETPAGN